MVRKTKEEALQTYHALLDAAEREFRARGVKDTTLAHVAAAAGVTRGAVYWHFKDKEALFAALRERAFAPNEALLQQMEASAQTDPLASLQTLLEQVLILVARDPRQRVMFEILFHRCEKNQDLLFFGDDREKRRECMSQLQLRFNAAIARGDLPQNANSHVLMHAMHAYLIGLIHEWLVEPEAYDLAQQAPALAAMFMAGVRARPVTG
ncbi:TetR family transcriptional regulator [Massilia sp. W12]|uniref:TetR family transcriptional regulator n=1 Tax=Massilia sp. W12 TaxID=3126507 RepID=UPI0030D10B02